MILCPVAEMSSGMPQRTAICCSFLSFLHLRLRLRLRLFLYLQLYLRACRHLGQYYLHLHLFLELYPRLHLHRNLLRPRSS